MISQLIKYCLPHLTTLIIITDNTSIPPSKAFSPLFYYNCFPSLKQISILTLTKYHLRKEEGLSKVENQEKVDGIRQEGSNDQKLVNKDVEQKETSKTSSQVKDQSISNDVLPISVHVLTNRKDCAVKTILSKHDKFKPQGKFYNGELVYSYKAEVDVIDYDNASYYALVVTIHDDNENRLANMQPSSQKILYKDHYYPAIFTDINSQNKCSAVVTDVEYLFTFYNRSCEKSEYWSTIIPWSIIICL